MRSERTTDSPPPVSSALGFDKATLEKDAIVGEPYDDAFASVLDAWPPRVSVQSRLAPMPGPVMHVIAVVDVTEQSAAWKVRPLPVYCTSM